jgi:hypothetical protein
MTNRRSSLVERERLCNLPTTRRLLEYERDRPSNGADRQMPLNRPLGGLYLVKRTMISDRQVRHDIVELPFKGGYTGNAAQSSLVSHLNTSAASGASHTALSPNQAVRTKVCLKAGTL